ncbi:amidohydrolase family protein [Paenibacillus sacheonensis]|uniref:Amidohydrolase family protein n=1 Tax=Paenibacillus sacheonensis TaxID=742054 RepID=A0A7X5BUQ4_9BACL|nr:amidohydrolase family protein [Paenibacillus sacheonensis]MBM7564045.1 putative TIM-barrel fold metal-dependent hydrolase [Paenibacillus sacheonensis]NBC67623.1 amidohydrolase family protein [Paenibacillus sacheonensis]
MSSIHEYVNQLRIIDGHEHLATPQIRKKENQDFFSLMHYLESDLITAGMARDALGRKAGSDEERAAAFLKHWERTRNTTYARMFRTAMEDLYGFQDWSVPGILAVNEKVKAATHDPNWYDKVLYEKSGIDLAFTLIQTTKLDYDRFRPIMFMDFTFKLRNRKDIRDVERNAGANVHTFSAYLDAVDALLHRFKTEGMVATKLGHAYWRSLASGKPTFQEAESVFNRLLGCTLEEGLSQSETESLQDYLIHFIIQRSAAYELPIQIHTGHHETSVSSNGNLIPNSNAALLLPLLAEYQDAKFVLLHCGFPYHETYLSIAKNYPNVYTDFTWTYIISPTAAKTILHQMIEMVPQTKIQGFGGDYNHVEGTYAHLKLARGIVADTLAEKIAEGALKEKDAMRFADRIFRENLIELYQLDL